MDAISELNAGLSGRYQIEREIGAGGMATVYLARDLRHDRLVALKVLRSELGAVLGAERFLSEIRVTANLQHPNLLPLFDSGECNGLLYYVMPYIAGESLRQRLDREKQLSIDEVQRLVTTICRALGYAHRHGVVHRDLKPENVLLHDGQPVIADFGIALAISNAAGVRLTQSGISLGTPQYMSPEQAAGDRTIDARSDIYVVGALTYEMLTGETPHTGRTVQAIAAKLMTEDPRPVSSLRRSVPAHLDAAVRRALEKVPADRFATAEELAEALSGGVTVSGSRQVASSRSVRKWKLATSVLGVWTLATVVWGATHRATPPQRLRFPVALPDSNAIEGSPFYRSFDLSPNGTQIAYIAADGVFIRSLDELMPRRLTTGTARDPRFSPDGAWITYVTNDSLRKVPVGGGPPVSIVDSVARYGWGPHETIVFTRSGPTVADLWRVAATGGRPVRFVHQRRPADFGYGSPSFLPDDDTFLIPVSTLANGPPEIAAYRFSDDSMRYLGVRGAHPVYLPDGLLLYVDDDDGVNVVSLNTRSLSVGGRPTRVLDGVLRKGVSAELAISSTGMVAYLPRAAPSRLLEYDRAGRPHTLGLVPGFYGIPRYSPDGRRIVTGVRRGPSNDIVVYDLATHRPTQLAANGHVATPEWTPDGRRVGWTEIEEGLSGRIPELKSSRVVWRASDGSDTATVLVLDALGLVFSPTPDVGAVLIRRPTNPALAMIEQLTSKQQRTEITQLAAAVPSAARFSPDGNWIAFQSSIPTRPKDVYIRRLSTGTTYQISTGGGSEPMWNPRGGELFYRVGNRLLAVRVSLGSVSPRLSAPDTLPFPLDSWGEGLWATYDVSPDGQRFLFGQPAAVNNQPIVVTRWIDEVRQKVGSSR